MTTNKAGLRRQIGLERDRLYTRGCSDDDRPRPRKPQPVNENLRRDESIFGGCGAGCRIRLWLGGSAWARCVRSGIMVGVAPGFDRVWEGQRCMAPVRSAGKVIGRRSTTLAGKLLGPNQAAPCACSSYVWMHPLNEVLLAVATGPATFVRRVCATAQVLADTGNMLHA